MSNSFPMLKGDRWYLLALLVFSVLAFLPWWREAFLAGMSVFGWLMAALMVLSPAGALLVFRLERRERNHRAR